MTRTSAGSSSSRRLRIGPCESLTSTSVAPPARAPSIARGHLLRVVSAKDFILGMRRARVDLLPRRRRRRRPPCRSRCRASCGGIGGGGDARRGDEGSKQRRVLGRTQSAPRGRRFGRSPACSSMKSACSTPAVSIVSSNGGSKTNGFASRDASDRLARAGANRLARRLRRQRVHRRDTR